MAGVLQNPICSDHHGNIYDTDPVTGVSWGFINTLDDGMRIFMLPPGGRWGRDHSTYEVVEPLYTDTLGLPVPLDGHNWASGMTDKNHRFMGWANHHNDDPHIIMSVTDDIADGFEQGPLPPNIGEGGEGITYPIIDELITGDTMFTCRDNGFSGFGDQSIWTWDGDDWSAKRVLAQGQSVPGMGPGGSVGSSDEDGEDLTNYSPYIGIWVEGPFDPNPGVVHYINLWRRDTSPETGSIWSNVRHSYWRSTDSNATFETIEGEPITPLPIYPNTEITLTGVTPGGVDVEPPDTEGFINTPSITIDHLGNPHCFMGHPGWAANDPFVVYYYAWHNGTDWVNEGVMPEVIGGVDVVTRNTCFWHKGRIWFLATGHLDGDFRCYLFDPGEDNAIPVSNRVDDVDAPIGWSPGFNKRAWRHRRSMEVFCTTGNDPRVQKALLRGRAA